MGIDWLIWYCFTSHSKIYYSWRPHNGRGKLQNLSLPDAYGPRSGRDIIMQHPCYDTGLYHIIMKDRAPHSVIMYDNQGTMRTFANPNTQKYQVCDWFTCSWYCICCQVALVWPRMGKHSPCSAVPTNPASLFNIGTLARAHAQSLAFSFPNRLTKTVNIIHFILKKKIFVLFQNEWVMLLYILPYSSNYAW